MKTLTNNWTKKDSKVYLLLFASQCKSILPKEKRKLIASDVDKSRFNEIYSEFASDNDYQCIQKILSSLTKFAYSQNEIQQLGMELKSLFSAKCGFSKSDKYKLLMLNRLLLAS